MDTPHHPAHIPPMDRVIIVGGGLPGTALALAQGGIQSTLIEPDAAPRADGRAYALSAATVSLLRALGLWERLEPDAHPILTVTASDGAPGRRPSPFALVMDASELGEGPIGHMVEDRHLRPALWEALSYEDRIDRIEGRAAAQEIEPRARLTLEDGREIEGALIVAADGRLSGTAARAGITRREMPYGQTSLTCTIRHERPHRGAARQLFLPAGPLAQLPLTGNRSSIVWTVTHEEADHIAALDDAGYLDALRARLGDYLGGFMLDGPRHAWPLVLSVAEAITAPRIALIGDAARAVHPIAGQGLNGAMKDVASLAEVLVEAARRGEDIGGPLPLARYARWRRFDGAALVAATDGFARLFSNDMPALRLARDVGMGLFGAVPALRRLAMREAAGLTGDRPRLLRGEPL